MPMRVLENQGIIYQLRQQSQKEYSAEGVAEDLGVPLAQVLKAMLVQATGADSSIVFSLVVIPGDKRLSLKKIGTAIGDKHVQLASKRDVERITGFRVGSVSVIGLRREDVPTYVDHDVLDLEQVIISAGRPDTGIALQPSGIISAMHDPQIGDYCED